MQSDQRTGSTLSVSSARHVQERTTACDSTQSNKLLHRRHGVRLLSASHRPGANLLQFSALRLIQRLRRQLE